MLTGVRITLAVISLNDLLICRTTVKGSLEPVTDMVFDFSQISNLARSQGIVFAPTKLIFVLMQEDILGFVEDMLTGTLAKAEVDVGRVVDYVMVLIVGEKRIVTLEKTISNIIVISVVANRENDD